LVVGKIEAGLTGEGINRSSLLTTAEDGVRRVRSPAEVIVVAVRWYLRYNLSYRDVEELLVERGVEVDHVTVYRWVQRFTPLLADAARFARHAPGDRWHVDDTYAKVNGVWRCVYRAVDQYGQVIDVLVSARRDAAAARRFFRRALSALKVIPSEVVTDAAAVYPAVLDELVLRAWHHVEQYANNVIEADHSRLKHRLRPMRGLRTDRTAQTIITGHAFMQNLRRGHYELGLDAPPAKRVAAALIESPKRSDRRLVAVQPVRRSGNATVPVMVFRRRSGLVAPSAVLSIGRDSYALRARVRAVMIFSAG
jgi:transposase-like protein